MRLDITLEKDEAELTVALIEKESFACSVSSEVTVDYDEGYGGDFTSSLDSSPRAPEPDDITIVDAVTVVKLFSEDGEDIGILTLKGEKYFDWFFDLDCDCEEIRSAIEDGQGHLEAAAENAAVDRAREERDDRDE